MTKVLKVLNNTAAQPAWAQSDLPPFQQAVLDRDDLDCLLADLDDLTEIVEIRVKADGLHGLSGASRDLLAARHMLLEGAAGALQIVYRFADRTWCDTLIRDGVETTLLRFEEPKRVD